MSRHSIVTACLIGVVLILTAGPVGIAAVARPELPLGGTGGPSRQIQETRIPSWQGGTSHCMIGVYLLSLHDFSFSENTFDATFWMWAICPETFTKPLDTLEFVNAVDVTRAPGSNQPVPNAVYRPMKVSGTFQHHWDLTDFPFDRQTLDIVIEDSEFTVDKLAYIPDDAQSGFHPDASTGIWKISDFGIAASTYTYDTTFGDPSWVQGDRSSDYSRLTVAITLDRNAYTGFFKLTSVVYIAFLLSLVSFLIRVETTTDLGTRLALVSGALFAAAINMQVASNALGNDSKLGLVDNIHLIAFAAIFFAAVVAIASRLLRDMKRPPDQLRIMNYAAMGVSATFFIVSNGLLIVRAARII